MKLGKVDLNICMLQCADDTLFTCENKPKNIVTLKAILRCFELISGLKRNFHKSKFGGLGVNHSQLEQYVAILNCSIMSMHFTYLGIPIRENPRRVKTWEVVVSKVRKRLARWKGKKIIFCWKSMPH